ncbi:hypothetical protein Bhyg_11951 [Pseudolycoriella hygida]|uniref:Uncharacterized protein n=1 Tax=Pseudolycoriella hygida TaxID=35572 RepID=A0A9Q0MX95_9DIPT|nr:hypothetical protein Bhyg_11951 [Pseudolycoriella hygida]
MTQTHASLFEESAVFKICDVPLVLNVQNKNYVLFGIVIFNPPLLEEDIGHYIAAIRLNNRWECYDDLRTKPYPISGYTRAVIHCIFYVRFDGAPDVSEKSIQVVEFGGTVSEDDEDFAGFGHSDESLYQLYHSSKS